MCYRTIGLPESSRPQHPQPLVLDVGRSRDAQYGVVTPQGDRTAGGEHSCGHVPDARSSLGGALGTWAHLLFWSLPGTEVIGGRKVRVWGVVFHRLAVKRDGGARAARPRPARCRGKGSSGRSRAGSWPALFGRAHTALPPAACPAHVGCRDGRGAAARGIPPLQRSDTHRLLGPRPDGAVFLYSAHSSPNQQRHSASSPPQQLQLPREPRPLEGTLGKLPLASPRERKLGQGVAHWQRPGPLHSRVSIGR